MFGKRSESIEIRRDGIPTNAGVEVTQERDAPGVDVRQVIHAMAPFGAIFGMFLLVLAFIGASIALQQAVAGLGALFKIGPDLAQWTSWAVAVGFIGHALLMAFAGNHALKFLNGFCAGLWGFFAVCLTALYSILTLVGITADTSFQEMQAKLAQGSVVIDWQMLNLGRMMYATLIALSIITLTVAVFVAIAMNHHIEDVKHPTLGHVAKGIAGNVAIIAAAIYSGLHVFTYGLLIGSDVFTCAISAVIAELTFIWASRHLIHARKVHYLMLTIMAVAYIAGVNWLENRALGAAAGIVDQGQRALAVHNYVTSDPLARTMSDLYAVSGILFVSAGVVVEYINKHGAEEDSRTEFVQPSRIRRLGDGFKRAREDTQYAIGQVRGERLPAPRKIAMTLAKLEPPDVPVVVDDEEEDAGSDDAGPK